MSGGEVAANALRVLLVERDERECGRLLSALRGGGYVIYSCQVVDGLELKAALDQEAWDVVLLNCRLPGLPAADALDIVRGVSLDLPVILVVDRGSRLFPVELLENGAQDFIFKSNPSRLLPLVERECTRSAIRRSAAPWSEGEGQPIGEGEARFLQLAGNIPECYWTTDAHSQRVTYVSKAYEQIWGRYVEALYGDARDWFAHVHPEDKGRLQAAMEGARQGGMDEYFRVIRPDGSLRWLHARNFPIRDEEGVIRQVGGVASDVTGLMASQRQMVHLAHYDSLTALPNQLLFYEQLRRLIALSHRTGLRLGVMVIDLDRFRSVNETLGHTSGDELLRQVAGRLSGSLRESDMVCRLSGDVFGVILAELENTEQAAVVGRRMIETLALPVKVDGQDLFATASLGVAFFPQDGQDGHTLVRNAEAAMRFAKQSGRNTYQFFSETMHADARGRIFLETDLRNAVMREEFILYYQPKVSCANGRMTGAEALLRWQHPRRGIVPPDEFIPLLEETGLIIAVGRWVLNAACHQAAAWRQAGLEVPSVSVNLSARQLQSETLCRDIADALAASGLPAACLDLEITESMLMQNADAATKVLADLKAMGVTLSLDDFGTGYSSLAYLKRFPLDAVKVDRSFVQDITADADDASITRAVITMAHHLKLKVVAEGVETEGQLALLISHQCDVIQGYFFSRPVPAEAMEVLWREDRRLPTQLLKSGTRKPMALFVGVEGLDEVMAQLERDGYRVCVAPEGESARQWFSGNLADVLVCGASRRGFDAQALLREARACQPTCERILLVEEKQWAKVAATTVDGTADRLIRLPATADTLRQIVEEALARRRLSDDYGRLSQEVEIAERELMRVEQERRRLVEENRLLQGRDQQGYAVLQEVMSVLPWPVVAVDQDGWVVLINPAAVDVLAERHVQIGLRLFDLVPEAEALGDGAVLELSGRRYGVRWKEVAVDRRPYGRLMLLQEEES